jgi:LuxR family maltose regulon positive regulatory protein
MIDTLLTTKLFLPTVRPNFVRRLHLVERLNAGLDMGHSLTLVSAPAGYGKTTLLSEWLASKPGRIAWLSLDEQDNSAPHFWMYLITAIQRTPSVSNTTFGQTALYMLEADQSASIQAILTAVLDDLTALSDTIMLVLDDYHVISNQAIHEGVAFLLGHQPRQLHLVLATRVDPPLPISRLRARGQLTELRLADLRFTADEAATFLNNAMNLDLTSPDVQTLETRTEGWIVGLQLAALSLKSHPDPSALIRAFSGSHRHILDYFGEEVLSGLPEPVQQFLLKTSILEHLCGSLCNALLNESSSQSVLEYLEQTNLFLLPLDEERNWYRYHHLFADLLRARLRRKLGEAEITRLHGSAAQWCEENGFPTQAISHALAAHDLERAACIVEQNTLALMTRGELATLLTWIKLLPEALARERPWLCVEQGWTLAYGGQLDDAESLLRQAEQCETSQVGLDRLQGHIAAQRAYIALTMGQFARAFELANRADQILPQDEYWVRTVVEWTRGSVLRIQGNLNDAASAFIEHVRLARACDNVWALMMGVHDLAMVYRIQGQLGRAAALVQDALNLVRTRGMANLGYLGRVETGLAAILYEQNKLPDAHRFLLSSIEKNRLWQNPNHVVFSQAHLARVLLAQGDPQGAQASLDQAWEMQRNASIIPVLKTLLETTQVRLWLSQGNRESVENWAHTQESKPSAAAEIREQELLIRSRWLLYQKQADEAGAILAELAESAERSGRMSLWIEIQMLQALVYDSIGDRAQAYSALEQSLVKGAPDGFVRVFLDEGEPLRRLLTDYRAQRAGSTPRLHAYVGRLLEDFAVEKGEDERLLDQAPETPVNFPTALRAGALQSGLLEPLSDRELEVLQGLASGLSYRDIAERLIVAQGTVKVHVHNIYSKLNVANRTQAITRGQELGLL